MRNKFLQTLLIGTCLWQGALLFPEALRANTDSDLLDVVGEVGAGLESAPAEAGEAAKRFA